MAKLYFDPDPAFTAHDRLVFDVLRKDCERHGTGVSNPLDIPEELANAAVKRSRIDSASPEGSSRTLTLANTPAQTRF